MSHLSTQKRASFQFVDRTRSPGLGTTSLPLSPWTAARRNPNTSVGPLRAGVLKTQTDLTIVLLYCSMGNYFRMVVRPLNGYEFRRGHKEQIPCLN